jgi:hypothetical protein
MNRNTLAALCLWETAMTETIHLSPHDPLPGGRTISVLRQFEEDDPDKATIEIILSGKPDQVSHPHRPDGTPMNLDEAIAAARMVAQQEGLGRVFVIDRMAGPREHDIMGHAGDHSIHMEQLSDTDEEDAVRGSDMRDIAHPSTEA